MMVRQAQPKTNLAPGLIAVIAVCIAVAILLTLLGRSGAPAAAPDEQLDLVIERIPFEAQNALRGELSRQRDTLEMIASENFSPRNCFPSWATSRARWACRSSRG